MPDSNFPVTPLNDSLDLFDLIKKTVTHQIESLRSSVKSWHPNSVKNSQKTVVFSLNENICLRLMVVTNNVHDLVCIETVKIKGFMNFPGRGPVAGLLQIHNGEFSENSENLIVKASMFSGCMLSESEGITETQAYINQGKATQIVAEALLMSENSPLLLSLLKELRYFIKKFRCVESYQNS